MTTELDDKTYGQIEALCDAGTALFESDELDRALDAFQKAYELVPEPKTNWEAGIWLGTAIGDCHYLLENYSSAKEHLLAVAGTPEGEENPFVQLRLGQCLFELDEAGAKERLQAAFDLEGEAIFVGEEEKYRDLVEPSLD